MRERRIVKWLSRLGAAITRLAGTSIERDELCPLCALKHLAEAHEYLRELTSGYPEHFFYALGAMSQAEAHLAGEYGDVAAMVRYHRKKLEMRGPGYRVPFEAILTSVSVATGYDIRPTLEKYDYAKIYC